LILVFGRLEDSLGESHRRAVQGVERLWKARGGTPSQFRHGLRDRRFGDRARRSGKAHRAKKLTTFHGSSPGFTGLCRSPRTRAAVSLLTSFHVRLRVRIMKAS